MLHVSHNDIHNTCTVSSVFLVQVQLGTEELRTSSLHLPGFELIIIIMQPSHAQGAGGSCFFSCPSLSQRLEYSLDPFYSST